MLSMSLAASTVVMLSSSAAWAALRVSHAVAYFAERAFQYRSIAPVVGL